MGAQDIKAAHHVTSSVETASAILNNIKNHWDAVLKTRVVEATTIRLIG